ncbi:hypothetical protein BCY91_12660 [Pelobium manganitolerans]|uniref:Lipoprotein n=1 Tax=Pelobium manganitolerans TaxID=1842495 RepID=A0A419S1X4_9SPHI|nr:hypothetical protein [Pelobium manganitolerans]RKD12489.1 hypothetical protein BCY91_12660 [Pelobium manganitolerans]
MKQLLLFIIIGTLIYGCQSKQERDIEKMNSQVKKEIQDRAFKMNATVEFLDFKFVKCDTIDENDLLESKASRFQEKAISFYKQGSNELDFANLSQRKMLQYRDLGWSSLYYSEKQDFNDYMKKAQEAKDSADFYQTKDSLIQLKIKANHNPKNIFETSFFVKARLHTKQNTENLLDTLYFHFDENHKILRAE